MYIYAAPLFVVRIVVELLFCNIHNPLWRMHVDAIQYIIHTTFLPPPTIQSSHVPPHLVSAMSRARLCWRTGAARTSGMPRTRTTQSASAMRYFYLRLPRASRRVVAHPVPRRGACAGKAVLAKRNVGSSGTALSALRLRLRILPPSCPRCGTRDRVSMSTAESGGCGRGEARDTKQPSSRSSLPGDDEGRVIYFGRVVWVASVGTGWVSERPWVVGGTPEFIEKTRTGRTTGMSGRKGGRVHACAAWHAVNDGSNDALAHGQTEEDKAQGPARASISGPERPDEA
ncbi:hypothetical protein BV20DRAFT_558071 [Pilatotrama ljubarskyi]|nr:hypothetical protein BV20DRAFT_558071 [Pilatotrama ljubarskyi]